MTQLLTHRRRAVLVVPGSDDKKVRKALASAADEVVIDLEDAVTVTNKHSARDSLARLLSERELSVAVSVRTNALTTVWASDDLSACAALPELASVVLPKTESAADLQTVDRALAGTDIGVQALVETPIGLENISSIAHATDRLVSVIVGYADLGAALGRSPSAPPEQWLAVQDRLLIAARAADVAMIDGPFLGIADDEKFRHASQWARDLGFDGKWVIHPAQLATATKVFTPSEYEVSDAHRVLDALAAAEGQGAGAAQLDGRMLDEAVAVAARRVLQGWSRHEY